MSEPTTDRLERARRALAQAERSAGADSAAAASSATTTPPPGAAETGRGPEAHARAIVLRQLAVGPRTRHQLERKLAERDCEPEVAARVLDRMSAVGLVDDEAYAEMFVRSKQETKGLATPALRHEMRQKGVPAGVIDQALQEVHPETERQQAEQLVARRLRTMVGLDREVQTRRLAGFLARKGYAPGIAYQVIREAIEQQPEHRRG